MWNYAVLKLNIRQHIAIYIGVKIKVIKGKRKL